jgi:eukaryotic-like serine/threonine-protein kinase
MVAGASIGPYSVLGLLGSGGMGEVYRAHDPRLARDVAIKVLRSDAGLDGERLLRFEHEARTASALSHPNVVSVYDFGSHDSGPYLVTELLEGEPLGRRIRGHDLTPQKAIEYGVQIAQGLAAVHDKGIVHGDLKPGNIFVTRDGRVKLLDFGLSRMVQQEGQGESDASTAAVRLQGTIGYLSPEQVRGQSPDHRSDIFALGLVLYEMLSGRKAFPAREPAAVLNAILTQDPPSLSGTIVAPPLARLLERCLEKRPEERFQSAHDIALALRAVADLTYTGPARAAARVPRGIVRALLAAVVCLVIAVAAGHNALPPWHQPAWRLAAEAVPLSSETSLEFHPALSADGQQLAFSADLEEQGNVDIYVKQLGSDARLRLTRDAGLDCCPKWSPDGRWIAFVRIRDGAGTIVMVPPLGGAERRIADVRTWFGTGLSFSPDGKQLAYSDATDGTRAFGIFTIATDTLEKRRVTTPLPGTAGDGVPAFSPDGQTLAFVRLPVISEALTQLDVATVPSAGGEVRIVSHEPGVVGGVGWSADGSEIVFTSSRTGPARLWAIAAAGGTPRALGENPQLASGVGAEALSDVNRTLRFDVSSRGQIAYAHSTYDTNLWLVHPLTQPASSAVKIASSTRLDEAPQFSPDGRKLAFVSSRDTPKSQIWVCDADGSACFRATSRPVASGTPRWSPDARTIVFDSAENAQSDLFTVDIETRTLHHLTGAPWSEAVPSFSRDGRSIYFACDRSGAWQIWRMPATGGPAVQVTRQGGFAAFEAPDGRSLYYSRDDRPGLWQVSVTGGAEERVLEMPQCWGYWALARQGVFFLDSAAKPSPEIRLLRYGARNSVHVWWMASGPACGESGLTATPDGSSLVYLQADRDSDLVLLDVEP